MSFSIALTGLAADNTALDVVGNNLANLNTTGYKDNSVLFKDLLTQATGSAQVGGGVGDPLTVRQFTQGSIQQTGGLLDGAIQGSGFFVVQDSSGQSLYTRDGSFQVDANGNLMTSTGEKVQGWSAVNGTVNTGGAISSIVIPAGTLGTPTPTANFSAAVNLDASAATGATFSTPIQVVDSLGNQQTLTVTFSKTGANAWGYAVNIPSPAVGGTGNTTQITTGNLTFDTSGKLTSPAAGSPVSVAVTGLADGAADLTMNWNLFDANSNPLVTQFAQASATSSTTQDGSPAATVSKISLQDGGAIVATTSAGSQVTLAQLALASISNPDSLVSVGNNEYQLGATTANPAIGVPHTGGRGAVLGGSLEASNVDIAKEFTNLMVYERSYEGNTKVITTDDQIVQDVLSLVR